MMFIIAGNSDEIRTRSMLILFILQPKLREQKEANNLSWMKAQKQRKNKSDKARSLTILYQVPQTRPAHLSLQEKIKEQQSLSG